MFIEIGLVEHCIRYVMYTHISMYNECEWFDSVQHNSNFISGHKY